MKHYLSFFSLLLVLLPSIAEAQKEGNIWYFGLGAGIDFNTSPPTILTNGKTNSREGVATISDKNTGKLLFYTEGTTVWNSDQQVMPNGSGLMGDYSSTQSAIIVPEPDNPDKYYVFTTAEHNGFRYSEVDMDLDGGKGDIITNTKNTLLIPENESTEKVIATRHCNGKDYWVITHTLNDNKFYVYPITATGIQAPLIFSRGSVIHANSAEITSYLKISPDGNLLAHAFGPSSDTRISKVEVMHFNNKTGTITGPNVTLDGLNYPYGVEFSPNGNLLYVSTQAGRDISQYDLFAPDVNASRVIIASSPRLEYGALQLAPDGKVYVSAENGYDVGYNYLGVINNPDTKGVSCDYVRDAIYLSGKEALIGLPTFIGSFFYDPLDFIISDTCLGSATTFRITNTKNIDSVKWDFGDNTGSTILSPSHRYKGTENYKIRLIIYRPCTTDTSYKTINIHTGYRKVKDTAICEGETFFLPDGKKAGKTGTYISSMKSIYGCDSIITTQLTVNPSFHVSINDSLCPNQKYTLPDGQIADQPGNYVATFQTVTGCDSIITTHLFYRTAHYIQRKDTICQGEPFTLPDGRVIHQEGSYDVTFHSVNGCDTIATYNIAVKFPPKINLGKDTCLFQGDELLLQPGNGFPKYEWQNGFTSSTMQASLPGTYWVKVSDECGTATDTIKISNDCTPFIYIPSAFSPNNDGKNDIFRVLNVHNQKLIRFTIYNRWGENVFHTTDISKGWDGSFKGVPQDMGSYVYIIKILTLEKQPEIYTGTVLLIR